MHILLTGANGFLGKRVLTQLQLRGHSVMIVERNINSLHTTKGASDAEFLSFDFAKDNPMKIILSKVPDAVIHIGWDKLNDVNDEDHVKIFPKQHLDFLQRFVDYEVPKFTVVGSALEYGKVEGSVKEDAECKPLTKYGEGKLKLYKEFSKRCAAEKKSLRWARVFNVFGDEQHDNKLWGRLRHAYDSGAPEFDLTHGDKLKDYLHVDAVANAIIDITVQDEVSGIINVGSGRNISELDIVQNFLVERNSDMKINRGSLQYEDYENFPIWANIEKLMSIEQKATRIFQK